jgi:hypothetical protein
MATLHDHAPAVAGRRTGLPHTDFGRRCRVSFVKVAEFQRRAVVHQLSDGPESLGFGPQTDTQPVNGDPSGELTAERAASYISKYAISRGLRPR